MTLEIEHSLTKTLAPTSSVLKNASRNRCPQQYLHQPFPGPFHTPALRGEVSEATRPTPESRSPAAGRRNTPRRSILRRLCGETWAHRKVFRAAPSPPVSRVSATRRIPCRASSCDRSTADSSGCGFLPRFPSTENRTPSRRTRTRARTDGENATNNAVSLPFMRCAVYALDCFALENTRRSATPPSSAGAIGHSNSAAGFR